jgi:uncharacterized protein
MRLVELVGLHIEATTGAPLVLLREHEPPHRVVPIFIGAPEAASIGMALSGEVPPRPLAHDVMAGLVQSLDGRIDAVEVVDVHDGSFQARLALSGPAGEQHLDSRPSDAIALAVRLDVPLFISDEVLDVAGTVLTEEPSDEPLDDDQIDDAVAEFRSFLDGVDASDFGARPGGELAAPTTEMPVDRGDAVDGGPTDINEEEPRDQSPSSTTEPGGDVHHPGN